jgi:hypothetical protein
MLIFSLSIFILVLVTYLKWGPGLLNDTITYFRMASQISQGVFPYSGSFSPGYPALVHSFSHLFNISFSESSFWLCSFFYVAILVLVYLVMVNFFELESKRLLALLSAFLLINTWWSLKIILRAHADGLFYVFHVAILLTLLLFLKNKDYRLYILSSALAAISVWVKYNGLIYLPYLAIVPFIFWGWNRFAFMGVIPVFLMGTSFMLFRSVNGSVIHHLEVSGTSGAFWQEEISMQTLVTNLSDSGNALFSSLFSNFFTTYFPTSGSVMFLLVALASFAYFTIREWGNQNKMAVIFAFPIIYIFGFLVISQPTNHTEANLRTLFPAVLFFLLGLFGFLVKHKFSIACYAIVFFVLFQPLQSAAGLIDWYRNNTMDSFKKSGDFNRKKSLKRLDDLMIELKLTNEEVYTNKERYLTMYFDYRKVNSVPDKRQFLKGGFRELGDQDYQVLVQKLKSEIETGNAIVIVFDANLKAITQYGFDQFCVERDQDDFIIY